MVWAVTCLRRCKWQLAKSCTSTWGARGVMLDTITDAPAVTTVVVLLIIIVVKEEVVAGLRIFGQQSEI